MAIQTGICTMFVTPHLTVSTTVDLPSTLLITPRHHIVTFSAIAINLKTKDGGHRTPCHYSIFSDFILEIFSMRYMNIFGLFLLFVSTGLTVCYSFRLFCFVLCGDFNFIPSYSMVETRYNMVIGIIGLLFISVFCGGSLIWLTFRRLISTIVDVQHR